MDSLKMMKEEAIHSRHIEIETFSCKKGGIVVEGKLKEDRLKTYYKITGEEISPHTVHLMIVRVLVQGKELRINEIEAEMPGVPRKECAKTIKSLQRIKGWKIGPGFTEKVKNEIGGKAGCTHLTTLLLTMAPAVVQGFWAYRSQKPIKDDISPHLMEKFLIDTCWVWRREGSAAKDLFKTIQK